MKPGPSPLGTRLAVAAAALLGFGLLYGVTAWRSVKDEQVARMQTVLEIARKATDSYFVELEASLDSLADDLQAAPGLVDTQRSARLIRRFRDLHPTFTAVNLLDPDGQIVAAALSPDRAALPRVSRVRGASWVEFQARLTPETKFDLGRPLRATVAPGWFFPMRYVLRDAGGQPVAFISATLSAEVLQHFWSEAPVVAKSSLGLIRDDGYLISLFPAPAEVTQDMLYGTPRSGVVQRAGGDGYAEGDSTILGQPAAHAWQRLDHFPVTMFVATPLAEYWRAWWAEVRVAYALMLLLGLAGAFGWHALQTRQQALEAERRRTEAALNEKRLAEQANRTKSEFMARMSHELRTPLNAILGFTQILQRDAPGTLLPAQQGELQHVLHAGHHLLSLIDDLLDLSRVEAGTLKLHVVDVDAADVVRDALAQIASLADAQGITVSLDAVPAALPRVRADRTRLRQVVLNLLSNAVKYNRPGGQVALALGVDGGRLRLAVRDTGPGLSEAQIAELFRPFHRLGRERGPIPGTGIGLVITRSLLELMDGRLEVRGTPGVGSEFRVELPLARQPTPEAAAGAAPQADILPEGAGDVLYVDDDEVNRLLMQASLAVRPRITLRLAASGPEALAMARAVRPDLLLIDLMMPGMSGLDMLAALRADATLAGIPCVAISANAMPDEVDAAMRAGFDGYLVKPLALDVLLREVDGRLAPGRAAQG